MIQDLKKIFVENSILVTYIKYFRFYRNKAKVFSSLVSNGSKVGALSIIQRDALVSNSHIGNNVFINVGSKIYDAKIEDYVSIGPNCVIGPNEHDISNYTTSTQCLSPELRCKIEERNKTTFTKISKDVWIGSNVFIKKGVQIGEGAVVAANAAVVRDVSPYSVVAGVPARQIKIRTIEINEENQ